jgi:hypothetical protein
VSIKDKLPPIGKHNTFGSEDVLVINEYNEMVVTVYHYGKKEWITEQYFGEPKYWMELPKPPNFNNKNK